MPKVSEVVDIKTKNIEVEDVKTKNREVFDAKPLGTKSGEEVDQLYDVVLGAGQPIGLLLTLTYPTAITVSSSKSP